MLLDNIVWDEFLDEILSVFEELLCSEFPIIISNNKFNPKFNSKFIYYNIIRFHGKIMKQYKEFNINI